MSVATTARKQQFTLDAIEDEFTFTFRALPSAPSDIKCIVTSAGEDTDLAYTTDFTVEVNEDGVGGVVTLVDPADVGTGTLTVYRETTNTQGSDYDDYNRFPADTVETDFDIRTLVSQEQSEALERTLKLSISASSDVSLDLPTPSADQFIGWNSAADALENKTVVDATTLTLASQANAEAGTNNTNYMSPLRTSQAITALQTAKASTAEAVTGSNFTKFLTPSAATIAINALIAASVYVPSSSNALSGSIIQVVSNILNTTFGPSANLAYGAVATGTTIMPLDDTIPQNTEGDQSQQLAITPSNASNKLKIDVVQVYSNGSSINESIALFKDSVASAICAVSDNNQSAGGLRTVAFSFTITAGTTSAITFKVRLGGDGSSTTSQNGITGGRIFGGVIGSSMHITEIKA